MPIADKITAAALAELTGLTDRRHRQLAAEGYFPKPVKGQYDSDATLKGLFRYYRNRLASRDQFEAADLRKRLADATLKEMEVGRLKKEWLPRDAVHHVWAQIVIDIRTIVKHSSLSEVEKHELLKCIRDLKDKDYENPTPSQAV